MSKRLCPLCRRPADPAFAPFCGKRCADVDLNRWLKEGYRLPAVEDEEEAGPQDGAAGQAGSGSL